VHLREQDFPTLISDRIFTARSDSSASNLCEGIKNHGANITAACASRTSLLVDKLKDDLRTDPMHGSMY